ncbi:hypothetical protein BT96DRAFT_690287 [Gymnopus androsaceus JB14]|uniref:Uncharacterized protein n=1 Tax=Gymnopus androsaceus JB14 TaxID=1447944 RepID=A0A6A4GF26_9AGAR|nr:hypothetical protein BT96DRAFT_690287 [Gymnopus androsaceus JB14]
MLSTPDSDHSFDFGSMIKSDFFTTEEYERAPRLPRPRVCVGLLVQRLMSTRKRVVMMLF